MRYLSAHATANDILSIFSGDDRSKQLGEPSIGKRTVHGQVKSYHLIIYTNNGHLLEKDEKRLFEMEDVDQKELFHDSNFQHGVLVWGGEAVLERAGLGVGAVQDPRGGLK